MEPGWRLLVRTRDGNATFLSSDIIFCSVNTTYCFTVSELDCTFGCSTWLVHDER